DRAAPEQHAIRSDRHGRPAGELVAFAQSLEWISVAWFHERIFFATRNDNPDEREIYRERRCGLGVAGLLWSSRRGEYGALKHHREGGFRRHGKLRFRRQRRQVHG